MTQDLLQSQRFERKYLVTEEHARQVRQFIRAYLEPDEHSSISPDLAYPVHSLYFDSDQLTTYWATVHCEKSRFKLRLRYYDENPDGPVFFEIKRRVNECVLKQRGAVHKSAAPLLASGGFPEPQHLPTYNPGALAALRNFDRLRQQISAHPKVYVAYEREAWVHPETNAVRITLDRHVRGETVRLIRFSTNMTAPCYPFGGKVVLELKFTNRFPDWFGQLVRHFDLVQCGAPKYCGSVAGVGEEWLSAGVRPHGNAAAAGLRKFF